MADGFQDVSDTELAILHILWDRGPSSIRQLTETLYPEGRASQYATVQKLLERLEKKGCVRRDRSQAVHVVQASIDREALLGRRLESVAQSLCHGLFAPLALHLVRAERLSERERLELRRLLDEMDRKPPESETR
ncbi:MAG: BlaI/MecI/CopY family transcriptional regulator [Pirellulales bacterium]